MPDLLRWVRGDAFTHEERVNLLQRAYVAALADRKGQTVVSAATKILEIESKLHPDPEPQKTQNTIGAPAPDLDLPEQQDPETSEEEVREWAEAASRLRPVLKGSV